MKLLLNGKPMSGIPLATKTLIRQKIPGNWEAGRDWSIIVNAMKLTVFLLLVMLVKVNAAGYAQYVTLKERNVSLEKVFKKITRQTGYVFFYTDDLLEDAKKISVDLKGMPLKDALDVCFRDQPYDYLISGNKTIAVRRKYDTVPASVPAPRQRLIHTVGRVLDAKTSEPIGNVSVSYAGGGGTRSSGDGSFRCLTASGETITFSYVGYISGSIKVLRDTNVVIRLEQTPQALKETVVTGIFNRKFNTYTGSVITLSNDDLRKVGNANVFQALRNISPSLILDNFEKGSNPNALPDIQFRGTNTFPAEPVVAGAALKGNYIKNPNEPLFILDGFEATIERIFDLDINRIERVTILKDAASKAIYGAKAANGVIVIETKKSISAKALVTYNTSLDIEIPDLTSYNLTNALEKLEAERIDGMYLNATDTFYIKFQQLYNSRLKAAQDGLNTDWIAKPLREGIGQRHTLGVELGGENLNVTADISYRQVSGVMKGSNRTNISGNLGASYRVKKLLFRNIMSVNKNQTNESPYGTFNEYAIMNPYWRAVNADGSIPFYAERAEGVNATNPLFNATLNSKIVTSYFNFTNNFYLEYTIAPGLRATGRLGIDVKESDADEFYPASHTRFASYPDSLAYRRGSYQVNNGKSNYIAGDLNVNYSTERNRHFYFANLGFNVSERKWQEVAHKVEGFSSDRLDDIIFGRAYAVDSRPLGIDGINREMGFLGAFSYMYDNRFLADLTLRANASSQFGADKKWAQFWSLGLGWNLHNETFMDRFDFVDQFKVRGSLGSSGNPNFATNTSMATYQYYLQSLYQGYPGAYLMNLANEALQWETKFDYNAGFDARMGGLSMRFDYYESYTTNLISGVSVPTSTGFDIVRENLGKVKNSGFEIFASYLLWSKGSNFISLNAGIETNKNRIVELSNAMKNFNANMDKQASEKGTNKPVHKYEDGMSMNAIWAVPSLGIDPANGLEIYQKRDGTTTYEWNAGNMIVVGNAMPSYWGVGGLSAEYRGIGLNVTARYSGGGQLYNQTLVDKVENIDMNYNVDKRVLTGRWRTPGQHAEFKRLTAQYTRESDGKTVPEKTRATSRFVQDKNDLTIAAVNVYYLFGKKFVSRLGMQRLKLAFNMNEVATFSTIRIERGTQYPFSRTVSFSLSTTFK
jgi:TonB-linked SusC/RagA family outer membrane protein